MRPSVQEPPVKDKWQVFANNRQTILQALQSSTRAGFGLTHMFFPPEPLPLLGKTARKHNMQIIGAPPLRMAGPSMPPYAPSVSVELTRDVKLEKEQPLRQKSNGNAALAPPTASSCKPATLSAARSKETTAESPAGQPSSKLVTAMKSEIDEFLTDVATRGYVLTPGESSIGPRLTQLEHHEHVLSPIAETAECPGGFKPMTLTYCLPSAAISTKPQLPPVLAPRVVLEVPPKNPARARPTNAWKRLGSRGYHFVSEDRVLWK